jgi:hypothetical protein
MSLFSFNSNKTEKVLLFDLKSESLSCSIVNFSTQEKPEILFYEKIEFGDAIKFGIKKYLSSMFDAFDQVSLSMRKKYLSPSGIFKKEYKVDNIHINISSPWILSQSKYFKVKKDKAFTITEDFVNQIKQTEGKDVFDSSLPKDKKVKDKFKVFEESIVQTKLNGYKIENVIKKSVNSFEVNVFLSIIQNDILEKILGSISKNIITDEYIMHSFILSGFSFVRDAYPVKNDFVLLDIGGETTEICVAQDDSVEKVLTFPFGKRVIINKISESLKVPQNIASSLINMKCHGNCDEKTASQVEISVNLAIKEWTNNLFEIFKEISPNGNIPKDIFIIADDEITGIVGKKIKESKLKGPGITDNDFNISILDDRKFVSFFKKQEIFTNDVHLRLAIILIDKIFKNKNLSH